MYTNNNKIKVNRKTFEVLTQSPISFITLNELKYMQEYFPIFFKKFENCILEYRMDSFLPVEPNPIGFPVPKEQDSKIKS